ncbi:MAG: hypothetical protein WHT29_08385 [Bacteroidales bacterium]
MKPLLIPLEKGNFYHVFNRGNNGDNLFYNKNNYEFFLRRLDFYLSQYIELYAYCLLPNHFHLLIRVKDDSDALHLKDAKRLSNKYDPVSLAFLKFFTSYSKAINKQQKRHGSLFENPFKRILVNNTTYLVNLVLYIHANPQLHGICDDFRMYPWCSYERILKNKPTKLRKDEVIKWFSDEENYVSFHTNQIDLKLISSIALE